MRLLSKRNSVLWAIVVLGCRGQMPDQALDPCDPYKGAFQAGEHYVDEKSITEEGNRNLYYMFSPQYKKDRNPCDPKYRKKAFEQKTR